MPETPKVKSLCDPVEPEELEEKDLWEVDQKNRDYYYDDSQGYETYDPESDDDDEDHRIK